MATSIGWCTPVFLPGEPFLWQKPGRPQSTGLQRVRQDQSDPERINTRLIGFVLFCFLFVCLFCLWQLCPSESWARRWCSCLACGGPGSAKCARIQTASAAGVMALSESFLRASCSWWSEGLFVQSLSLAPPIQALRGIPCLRSFYVVLHVMHIEGPP